MFAEPPLIQDSPSPVAFPAMAVDWESLLDPSASPLHIDIGCGYGRFLLAWAALNPQWNFLGVERKVNRVRSVARAAQQRNLSNVWLLHAEANGAWMQPSLAGRVASCYLFFPDPWPKRRHHKHRLLFQPNFLARLLPLLQNGGTLHVATDDPDYFAQATRLLHECPQWEEVPPFIPPPIAETDFALRAQQQGQPIYRLSMQKVREESP